MHAYLSFSHAIHRRAVAAVVVAVILLAAGAASGLEFDACERYVAETRNVDAEIADLDGDGDLDFATVGSPYPGTGKVTIFLGDGNGLFTTLPPPVLLAGNTAQELTLGDFNGDEIPDIAVANRFGSDVSVFLGNGDGTFVPAPTIPAGSQSISVSAGDLNADSDEDLVVVNHGNNNVQIMLGNGDGTFTELTRVPVSSGPNSCDIVDVDHDNIPDLVVPGWWGYSVSILLGNGDGTFVEMPTRPPLGRRCWDLAVADLNEDSHQDLIAPNTIDGTLSVLLGNGDGTFASQVVYPIGIDPYEIAVVDITRDGNLDVVAGQGSRYGGGLWVFPGNGDGTIDTGLFFPCGNGGSDVEVGDLNGDGLLDTVLSWLPLSAEGAVVMLQTPRFCDSLTDTDVVLCEDFSSADVLADFIFPPTPPGRSRMEPGWDSDALTFTYPGSGFAREDGVHQSVFGFRDSSLQIDMTFETSSASTRSAAQLGWAGYPFVASNPEFGLVASFQHDRNYIRLGIWLPGQTLIREDHGFNIAKDTTYRVQLEVEGNDRIRVLVDGTEIINRPLTASESTVLASFPSELHPYVGGNSYLPDMVHRYDNLVVRNLNGPPEPDAGDNVQIVSAEQWLTVVQGTATDPNDDPMQYRWLEGTTVLLDWTAVGAGGEAPLDLGTLPGYLALGPHTLTLEATDGDLTASDEMILTVDNSPPEVEASPLHQVIQIGVDPVVVVADAADFDGDTLSFEWLLDAASVGSGVVTPPQGGAPVVVPVLILPAGDPRCGLGVHAVGLQVDDSVNPPVSDYVTFTVHDTIAPSLGPIPSTTILWPPNHKLVPVTIQANAFDNGGGPITLDVTVESSEPPDADGDGNTIPDWYIDSVNDATGIIELRLRAERSGKGDGRVYTILITATDASGNAAQGLVEIRAPHDKGKKK